MRRQAGGQTVPGGYYWSLSRWEIVLGPGGQGKLPGAAADAYWALPLPAIPLVVSLMAVLSVFFVPAIGFVMVGWAVYRKLAGKRAADKQAASKGSALPNG
ncbi:MAG: hypothetical protein HY901_16690 [Deltaproteobacteria bacterium]|nr:hypothetical protein [Deltaproteobacteria bacterium]